MKKVFKICCLVVATMFCGVIFASCKAQNIVEKASKGLTSYAIEANIDDKEMKITATERVEVVNKTKVALDKVCFNLYARAFREGAKVKPYTKLNEAKCFPNGVNYGDITIISVLEKGNIASYEIVGEDENALQINLSKRLEPGDKVLLQIDFVLKLAESCHRLGYLDGSVNLGNWFPILAEYQKGEFIIDPYYSTGDPFFSDIANYDVKFTYADKYRLASTGEVKKETINGENKTDYLKALAVRDFAITLTQESNMLSKKVNNISVNYIGYKEDQNSVYALDVAVKAVKYFSEVFGEYPYKKLDMVKAPFVHGGMEYPCVVMISDSFTDNFDIAKVIVHEVAHQWWYAVVGNNEISEAWLDESLAEYSTALFFEKHKEFDVSYEELVSEAFANYTLYADIVKTTNKQLNTSMLLRVNEYAGDYEYSYMIYVKGVLMFDSLRQVVGKAKLEDGLRKYYKKYKFKIAKTDDLIVTMRKATGKDIEGFFDSWLNGRTVIGTI